MTVVDEKNQEIPVVTPAAVIPVEPEIEVGSVPPVGAPGAVQVTAPMDLQEGYQMEVQVNGQNMTVTVPPGGVRKGDVFTATPFLAGAARPNLHIPMNQWRDGLCDCCTLGCCHAACCLGTWCGPILLGQVMTRMSRNWFGGAGNPPSSSNTCIIVTVIFVVFIVIDAVISGIIDDEAECSGASTEYNFDNDSVVLRCPDGTETEASDGAEALSSILSIVTIVYVVYLTVITCMTRAAIRNKFNIPTKCCGGCEDCCCAYWCFCCTVTQMARHTHDYKENDVPCCSGNCCSKTGQPPGSPEIV